MSETLATSPRLDDEADTVEGRLASRLADIMETAEVRCDEYRLSDSDRGRVIAALRAAAEDWRTDIENAPKDGSDVLFPINFVGRAYWCADLKRWVLAYPLHMECVSHPTKFRLPKFQRDATAART